MCMSVTPAAVLELLPHGQACFVIGAYICCDHLSTTCDVCLTATATSHCVEHGSLVSKAVALVASTVSPSSYGPQPSLKNAQGVETATWTRKSQKLCHFCSGITSCGAEWGRTAPGRLLHRLQGSPLSSRHPLGLCRQAHCQQSPCPGTLYGRLSGP